VIIYFLGLANVLMHFAQAFILFSNPNVTH